MSSFVVAEGDTIVIEPTFGSRQVELLQPAFMLGSGEATVEGRRICVVGDEKRVELQAQYFIPGYSPGAGIVSVEILDGSQMAPCISSGAPLILMGQQFTARFTPTLPAVMSSPPNTPDLMEPGIGRGQFLARQIFVTAA